jgi:SAM-dependent methyltransferase
MSSPEPDTTSGTPADIGDPDAWVYGDYTPDPDSKDLIGMKARWILDCLPAGTTPDVLDYGVGEGKHLHLVRTAKPHARLVGVDVREAHRVVDFEFHRVAPDAPLPFADESFDVVVSCDVLEHVNDIQSSLDEIRRVLRRGGEFIGFVPMEGGPGPHSLFRLFDPHIYRDTKDHNHAYRRRELRAWLEARFRILKLSYSYHFIGSALDAAFFASFKAPGIGAKMQSFWRGQENLFYRGGSPAKPSLMGRVAQAANRAAYWESRVLKNFPYGCIGLHFHLQKP